MYFCKLKKSIAGYVTDETWQKEKEKDEKQLKQITVKKDKHLNPYFLDHTFIIYRLQEHTARTCTL